MCFFTRNVTRTWNAKYVATHRSKLTKKNRYQFGYFVGILKLCAIDLDAGARIGEQCPRPVPGFVKVGVEVESFCVLYEPLIDRSLDLNCAVVILRAGRLAPDIEIQRATGQVRAD